MLRCRVCRKKLGWFENKLCLECKTKQESKERYKLDELEAKAEKERRIDLQKQSEMKRL